MKFKLHQRQAAMFLKERNSLIQGRCDDDVVYSEPTVHYNLGLVACTLQTHVGVWLDHTEGTFLNMRIGDTSWKVSLNCLDHIEVDTDGVSINYVDIHLTLEGQVDRLPF